MAIIELFPILLLLVLLLSGIPIAYSLIISSSIGLILVLDIGQVLGFLGATPYETVSSYLLSTIPMFILMAEFLRVSGLTTDIFTAIHRWVGHIRGGLAMAATIANGVMAALSGSSTASAATLSNIAVPEMQNHNYDDRLALGTVSASGTFAIMFPPSLGLIVYGVQTQTSIASLFIAGIIPGVITLISYMIVIYTWGYMNPAVVGGSVEATSWDKKLESLRPVWSALLLVIVVIGGLYGGVFTPTESGGVGAFGAFLVAVGIKDIRMSGIRDALLRTTETTTMIFMIVIGADLFGRYLTITGLTSTLIEYISGLPVVPIVILVILLLLYVLLGTVMDQLAILLITLPITYPLATDLGFDSIWFGVLIAKTIEIGLVTPPLGINVFVATAPLDMDVDVGFRGAARFIIADFIVLALMLMFPEIVTWLPSQIG